MMGHRYDHDLVLEDHGSADDVGSKNERTPLGRDGKRRSPGGKRPKHSIMRMNAWVAAAVVLSGFSGRPDDAPVNLIEAKTDDNLTIVAELHLPEGVEAAPLVVLAHQLHSNRQAWAPFVPLLVESGYAVVAYDVRSFGESTREVATPSKLNSTQRESLELDILAVLDEVAGREGVDSERVAIVASGLTVTPAVRCAIEREQVRMLVLMAGGIQPNEEDFLMERPDFPVLLVAAVGDERGAYTMSDHGSRLTGPQQQYFAVEATNPDVPDDWVGTDGLQHDTGLADLLLWFVSENLPAFE